MEPKLPVISETSLARDDAKRNSSSTAKDNNDDDNAEEFQSSPLWDREEEGWQMTWPIWHRLPREERKALAHRHGYKTIGGFEEHMSLQQAVDDSEIQLLQGAFKNEEIPKEKPKVAVVTAAADTKTVADEEDDGEDSSSESGALLVQLEYERQGAPSSEDLSLEELTKVGGTILLLHDEILHQVFSWLPVDTYGTLAFVSPHWKHLTRTESVYRRLCERLYLNQSKRRQLHASHFGGSYRRMLEQRPRVRAAGGCYVLKYSEVKKIERDMWTEIPLGAILESIYYRYLYFQEDGRVLYALTSAPPKEMFRRFLKMCLKKVDDPAAVWGTYQVQKNALTIVAEQAWHTVKFELTIDEANSDHGRFGSFTMDGHFSSKSACFEDWSRDRVEYAVPNQTFRFVKDPRL